MTKTTATPGNLPVGWAQCGQASVAVVDCQLLVVSAAYPQVPQARCRTGPAHQGQVLVVNLR